LLAPIGSQEIWAAGVTYYRSRDARIAESRETGGSNFYDRVYEAERPELFLKATPGRVAAPGGAIRLRRDSHWIVPEPELTLVINRRAEIIGYTVGNDVTCRDIEAENPLYLPQAKIFDDCAAIGPGLLIQPEPLPASTAIDLEVRRGDVVATRGRTTLAELKRRPAELVQYLTRETRFPAGCFLMTGTGIVPEDAFRLADGDEVHITIEPIGTLVNTAA
jgi:2-dehydro-3-deoxy-D-arabinonate dehydratase